MMDESCFEGDLVGVQMMSKVSNGEESESQSLCLAVLLSRVFEKE